MNWLIWPLAAATLGLLLLPLLLAFRRQQRRLASIGAAVLAVLLAVLAGGLWLPSLAETLALRDLDRQYQQFQRGESDAEQMASLLADTLEFLADCDRCERLRQLHQQMQQRYVELLWQQGHAAAERGEYQQALGSWSAALDSLSSLEDAPPELYFQLLGEIGRIQKLLRPEAEVPLRVVVSGSGWLGLRLRLTARLLHGPSLPLAQREFSIAGWPLQLQLDSDDALLPGFDLGAARRRGDRVRLQAVVLAVAVADSAPDSARDSAPGGSEAILASAQAELDLSAKSPIQLQLESPP